MGKVIFHGGYTSSDDIPQPTSIIMGRNLRSNSETISKQKPKAQTSKPTRDLHGKPPALAVKPKREK